MCIYLHPTALGDIENCDALPRTTVDLSLLNGKLNQPTFYKTQKCGTKESMRTTLIVMLLSPIGREKQCWYVSRTDGEQSRLWCHSLWRFSCQIQIQIQIQVSYNVNLKIVKCKYNVKCTTNTKSSVMSFWVSDLSKRCFLPVTSFLVHAPCTD